jgi:peptidoglycan/LPS O-acetylase OafA/YrhL
VNASNTEVAAEETSAAERPSALTEGALYRPQLDWLRFFAFLGVFLHHFLPKEAAPYIAMGVPHSVADVIVSMLMFGAYGVDLFFTLSAFLITDLLLREKAQFTRINIKAFYIRRILRIWPLYFGFLLVTMPFEHFTTAYWQYLLALTFFAGNWYFAFFGGVDTLGGPLWSVSIEEQFYLAWPFILRFVKTANLIKILLVMLLTANVTRLALVLSDRAHPALWCNTFARLDPIVLGAMLALLAHKRRLVLPIWVKLLLLLAGLSLINFVGKYGHFDGFSALYAYPAATAASGFLVLACLGIPPGKRQSAPSKFLAYLGKISYGLYVFQILGFRLACSAGYGRVTTAALGLMVTFLIAAGSYATWEKPFLRLKRKRFTYVSSRAE